VAAADPVALEVELVLGAGVTLTLPVTDEVRVALTDAVALTEAEMLAVVDEVLDTVAVALLVGVLEARV
jgi:hypothetical protein